MKVCNWCKKSGHATGSCRPRCVVCKSQLREDGTCPFRCPNDLRAPHKARQMADRVRRQQTKREQAAPLSLAEVRQLRVTSAAVPTRIVQSSTSDQRCSRCGNKGHVRRACGDRKKGGAA